MKPTNVINPAPVAAPATIQINMRNVDAANWTRLRIESVRRHVSMTDLLNQAVAEWLAAHEEQS